MSGAANEDIKLNQSDEDENKAFRELAEMKERFVPLSEQDDSTAAQNSDTEQSFSTSTEPTSSKAPHLVVVSADAENADSMGARLRAARENQDLSLQDMARATRIRRDYLQSIEQMDVGKLPGMPQSKSYLRGWVKSYAKQLELPEVEQVVERYLNEIDDEVTADKSVRSFASVDTAVSGRLSPRSQREKSGGGFAAGAMTAIVVIAALGAGAWFLGPWSHDVGVAPYRSTVPSSTTASQSAVRPIFGSDARSTNLSLKALGASWIEVRGSDGTVYLSKEMKAGEVYVPRVGAGWTITVADGASFEWRLNGQSLGVVSEVGGQVHAASVDAALERERVNTED